ncbi:MAG: Rrf2 family transcriptional regulator [Candidatus Eisenbacteria bacterium]|nr:Rrf2 family transcriptional regulator [Candidatus Eisenbacteria bacterium]
MLTKTTRTGLQTLLYLALRGDDEPTSPRVIAAALHCSPSYLAKVTGQLVRAGILSAHRGVKGGVTLSRKPREITLLEVVQALQGPVLGDYCSSSLPDPLLCQFHHAMYALHRAMLDTLTRWSLADIATDPGPGTGPVRNTACIMHPILLHIGPPAGKRSRQ